MGELEKIADFESQPLSMIIYNLIKWYNYDSITMQTEYRASVESRVWISIKIEKAGKNWYVDGQRLDIVKNRLIEWHHRNNSQ